MPFFSGSEAIALMQIKRMSAFVGWRAKSVNHLRVAMPDEYKLECSCWQRVLDVTSAISAGYINGQNILADGGAYPGSY